jgi:hypothetical protein
MRQHARMKMQHNTQHQTQHRQQLRYTTTLAHARAHLIARHTHAHSSFILRGTRAQAQVPAPRSLTCPRIKRARRRWHPPVCVLGTSATRPRQARTNLRFEHVRQPVLGVAVGNTLASAVYSTHTHTQADLAFEPVRKPVLGDGELQTQPSIHSVICGHMRCV